MAYNVIQVSFGGSRKALTAPINYRDDIGQVLKIKGLALPTYYVVDFCNEGDAQTKPMTGTADGVSIPDEFLATGQPIKAYIVLSDENSTQTRYEVTIPVNPRPRRTDIAPTPAEQQAIDALVDAMNDAVEDASDSATAAAGSATDAGNSATAAHNAQIAAETAQDKAETAQGKAEDAQEAAETAQGKAEDAQAAAEAALAEFTEITVSAETLEPGSPATADYENGHLTLGIPEGEKGDQGDQGVPGQAATIAVGTTTTLQPGSDATVQNSGTSSAAVFDFGIPKGEKGDPGTDGVSPTVTVETISGGHEVTITDKNGNHEFNVMDGIDGTTFTPSVSNEGVISWSNDGGKQNPTPVNIKGPKGDTGEVSQAEFETALDSKAPVIIDSASGAIASFPDGADGMPVNKLLVNLSPKQDLHGYDRPWPAKGSKNLMPNAIPKSETVNGVTFTLDEFGVFKITGTASALASCQFPLSDSYVIPSSDPSPQVAFCNSVGTAAVRFKYYNGNTQVDSWSLSPANRTQGYSSMQGKTCNKYVIDVDAGTTVDMTISPMILANGVTDYTYSPYSNICPISGWSGVEAWRTGTNIGIVKNLYVGGASGLSIGGGGVLICFSAVKGQTYRISGVSGDRNKLYKFRGNMEDIKSGASMSALVSSSQLPYVITADETCIYCYYRNTEWSETIANSMIVSIGDTATAYEEFRGDSYSVTFGETVYGAKPDLITGEMPITKAVFDMGDLNFTYIEYLGYPCFTSTNKPTGIITEEWNAKQGIICSMYPTGMKVINQPSADKVMTRVTDGRIFVRDFDYTDPATFKAAVTGQKIVYELADPIETTITPIPVSTLEGDNNIWSDGDSVEVEYCADTKLYIEKLTQPTEDDMIADHAISAGTFFMIGNTLYLATAQIAAGATITPGTNATRLSLADALNQLNT